MGSLAIMEQGVRIGVESDLFVLSRAGKVFERIRVADVDRVELFGNVGLTPSAVARLLRDGTDTVFLTMRGNYRGRLYSAGSKNTALRMGQFEFVRDMAGRMAAARAMVSAKIRNQRSVLLRAQRRLKDPELAVALSAMRRSLSEVEAAPDPDALRGVEGNASSAYFGAFGKLLKNPDFSFSGRNRRPPRDPVNAVLSFGYVRAGTIIEGEILRAGLDPAFGVLHEPAWGRASLALDILEEFRPVLVDQLALRLVNLRQLRPEDFETPATREARQILEGADFDEAGAGKYGEDGASAVLLADTGRRIFFREFSKRLSEQAFYDQESRRLTLDQIVRKQVQRFARLVSGKADSYVGYTP